MQTPSKGTPGKKPAKSKARVSYLSPTRTEDLDPRVQYITSFWCQVEDPASHETVYVNPVTGDCRWDLEPGTFCLPQDPQGMWWEIQDEKQGGLCYYFNTKTKETTWTRPANGEGLVIPLSALQESGSSRRFSQYLAAEAEERDQTLQIDRSTLSDVAGSETTVSPPASPVSTVQGPSVSSPPSSMHSSPQKRPLPKSQTTDTMDSFATARDSLDSVRTYSAQATPTRASTSERGASMDSIATKTTHGRSKSWTQQLLKERSPFKKGRASPLSKTPETPTKSVSFGPAIKHRRKTSTPSIKLPRSSTPTTPTQDLSIPPVPPISPIHLSSPTFKPASPSSPSQLLTPVRNARPRTRSAEEDELTPLEGRPQPRWTASAGPSLRTKRLSTGEHQVLPSDLQSQLSQFSLGGMASKHFAQRKVGFFNRKVIPISQLASWQKAPLDAPLRDLERRLAPEALKSFKLIQVIMGDRDRSASHRARAASIDHFEGWITEPVAVLNVPWSAETVDDARDVLVLGVKHGALRDEIYMQMMKQLTPSNGQPTMHALLRGWQLFQVVLCAFPPSRDLEPHVRQFFQVNEDAPVERSEILRLIAQHCRHQLAKQALRGPRGRAPNKKEILVRSMDTFNPRSFGESLEHAQSLQESAHGEVPIPLVVVLLCNSLLSLGALKTEGVFRLSADSDALTELKASVDGAALHVDSAYDVHTVASALKVYFRDLPEPLIPSELYQECLLAANHIDVINRVVNKLPLLRRRIFAFLVSFLQMFTDPDAVVKTRMPAKSLAMVWVPNVLRCESNSMKVAFSNAPHEQTFFYTLLKDFDPRHIDLQGFRPTHPYPVPVGPFQLTSSAMDHLKSLVVAS